MNCGYYNHDFQKKGPLIETANGEKSQEMECSKCGISTYYPEDAFRETEGETFEEVADSI